MKQMFGLLMMVGLVMGVLSGCGDDKSVSSILEEDYGIRTLKNGSTLEGTIYSEDGMHMYLLEVPTAKILISVTGSKDIGFTIAHKGPSEWSIIDTIDEQWDTEPDIEVFNGNLIAGTYTISVETYDSGVSYTVTASW